MTPHPMIDLEAATQRLCAGGADLTEAEAYGLLDFAGTPRLWEAAAAVTAAAFPADGGATRRFDSCSIINVRSGRCPEDCQWCAQSAHYRTGCATHGVTPHEQCLQAARENHRQGVGRFSLVASGRRVQGAELDQICGMLRDIRQEVGISTCASLGLLDRQSLQRLWDAGVRRYHCNLETAPSLFRALCTTHAVEDKLSTIQAAHQVGMEVCSGGIIGMGETPRQRVEFALALRQARPVSIPINVLVPIPGTPLQDAAPITEEEILDAVAVMRMIHPRAQLRFAGGRQRLSRDTQLRALRIGVNGAIVGDLLTTIGSRVAQDRQMAREAGYEF